METMTPREIVQELDRHIIGQKKAKRAVAIALRNRWRRTQVDKNLRDEIVPKNILMIGPTGVGKTEIARRLATLARAPFIKVEATKYTERGYVGGDVESIVRDLADTAVKQVREFEMKRMQMLAEDAAEERILDYFVRPARDEKGEPDSDDRASTSRTRQTFRKKLREGKFDDDEIEIEVASAPIGVEIMAPPGMEEMTSQLQTMFQSLGSQRTKTRKLKVKEAFKLLTDEEASKLINEEEIRAKAIEAVEQNGIVFIDEIDKVTGREGTMGADVSREGVQRDLLPLIEGTTVSTKYGPIKTDHILFIASGAFHVAKPSDLIAELQGRLPIRVELDDLSAEDFERILTEPDAALTAQYTALLATENVTLKFSADGIKSIAKMAFDVNKRQENIGARRLHTVIERVLEDISFGATDRGGDVIEINRAYVEKQLGEIMKNEDLTRYIL